MRQILVLTLLAGCSWLDAPQVPRPPATDPPPASQVDPDRPSFDNRPGCQAFVAHVNELPCMVESAHLRPELVCAEALSRGACDASAFWTCAAERTVCSDGVLERAQLGGCPDPCGSELADG